MLHKTCKTLGYMEIIVFEIPSGGSKTISIPWPSVTKCEFYGLVSRIDFIKIIKA